MSLYLDDREIRRIIRKVDEYLDENVPAAFRESAELNLMRRVTKVCEESGEVWKAWSRYSGENPRKGVCGTLDELLDELGDTIMAALVGIQHVTKDESLTWAVLVRAAEKSESRIREQP